MVRSDWLLRLVVVASLVLAGCSQAGPLTLAATFPPSSDGSVNAMAFSLIDQTGLVTGMSPAAAAAAAPRVIAEPGDASALRVEWVGNDCDGRTTLVLSESSDGYLVTIHVDPTSAGGFGCQQLALPRAVTIRLLEPIAADRVTITQQFP